MNKIIEHQNDRIVLDRLSAQRNLYSAAKRWRNLRFVLCVLTIVVLSVIRAFFVDNQTIAIILGSAVFVSLLLGPIFNRQISRNRILAARIQQLFLGTRAYGDLNRRRRMFMITSLPRFRHGYMTGMTKESASFKTIIRRCFCVSGRI